jgi:DNA invertase Pin-like site-specific DNA recombinase
MKVAIYARASTNEQVVSCDDQVHDCEGLAARLKLVVAKDMIFIDDGISGARSDRQSYQRMISHASNGDLSTLLLYKQSRLARDSVEVEKTMRRLEFWGVRIITVDGYDTDTQTKKIRRILRGNKAQQDEMYRMDLSEETHRGQKAQFRRGFWTGGRVYGYGFDEVIDATRTDVHGRPKHVGTLLKVDPVQSEHVRWIYKAYADDGLSTNAIAADLNARSVPSPGASWRNRTVRRSDGKWMASTVDNILRQPLYFGEYWWNRSLWEEDPDRDNKKVRRERPEGEDGPIKQQKDEWRIFGKDEDPLRLRVEQVRAKRRAVRGDAIARGIATAKRIGGADSRFWLGSILKCGLCGANYIGDSGRDFICPGHKPGACTNDMRVRREAVNEAVYSALKSHLLSEDSIERSRRLLLEHFKAMEREEKSAVLKRGQASEIRKLDKQIAEARATDWPKVAKDAAIAAFEGERAALLEQAGGKVGDRLVAAHAVLAKIPAMVEDYRQTVEAGLKVLADPKNVSKARELVRGWLVDGKIVLTPDAGHTEVAGPLELAGLEHRWLQMAGLRRKVGARPRKPRDEPTSHVTVVAGAGFEPATFGL